MDSFKIEFAAITTNLLFKTFKAVSSVKLILIGYESEVALCLSSDGII